ncbi:MAG TPA: lysophospholipid acyltransferase family protein [Candidatus Acidoferrales bacterium]|jgi:1-acyl-sn-glycerol-3-phosphate acyltransferase|nr:lysophospholipid acyltransferase family protein [Candidatus Acidoferrales bacterium]
MAAAVRTLVAAFLTCLVVLFGLPFLILWTWITRKPDSMYRISMSFCRWAMRLVGIRARIDGIENIPAAACIFAANHASNLDGIILLPAIPQRTALFAKKELFRLPVLGLGMRLAGFVPVDRGGRSAAAGVATAVDTLKRGLSVFVFPEGTRSPDGRLQPFKKGAFAMAIESGAPIVPVTIAGTHRLMPRGAWIARSGEIAVRFGPAVDASAYAAKERGELLERIAASMAAALPPDQKPERRHAPAAGSA